ncbi:hypothetical protein [Arsenophonus apicola]|uniref:hypothetical protein n=1 Tax=Arsenophonus apicola TaxID=2879119 RepID=UPI001CDD02C3|nr:hypothetical protein [Arsenophonus apicola]UBX28475.1 hypothetical protein LDL57_11745 [Arsenophonus apicola]
MNKRDMSLLQLIGATIKQELIKQENDFVNKINAIKESFETKISELQKQNTIDKQLLEEKAKQQPEISLRDIEQLINTKIADLAKLLPAQKIPDIDALITDAISKLPPPKDGKSVSLDDVRSVITEEVKKHVADIPTPKDGEDADPDIVAKKLLELMPKPKDGQDGRDALDIEILPDIDESKNYPRGTFATHRGGIWRAFQKTTGMHGWECVINGHYAENREMKDARTLVIRSEMADGQVNTSEYTIPTMIYCGVYSSEKEYQKGDVTTWGGSLWHCNEQTKDKPGEHNSKGWTLIVKRGRDGKDRA